MCHVGALGIRTSQLQCGRGGGGWVSLGVSRECSRYLDISDGSNYFNVAHFRRGGKLRMPEIISFAPRFRVLAVGSYCISCSQGQYLTRHNERTPRTHDISEVKYDYFAQLVLDWLDS